MNKIAIVDDNEFDLFRLKNFIESSSEFDGSMEVSVFSSGIDFLDDKKDSFDLILMDMQMEVLGGFETACEMRRLNTTAVLCFCSAEITPQPEHFEVLPYRYILKTESPEKIKKTVEEILSEMKRRNIQKTIELSSDGAAFVVPLQDILYMEKQKRGTLVILSVKSPLYSTDANLVSRQKLSELYDELKEDGFAIPHSSYLVNLKKIITVEGDSLRLENDVVISISRGCREEFHNAFSKFFSKKYRRDR